MSWAALLVAFALGAAAPVATGGERARVVKASPLAQHHYKPQRACKRQGERRCRKPARWRLGRAPGTQPVTRPAPVPTPTPTPTPVPGQLPSRTGVDLTDDDDMGWRVTPAYNELRAGPVEFNATNLGMDDHDFSLRAAGPALATIDLGPGESGTLQITLAAGVYTLYCSLPNHEAQGMRADVTLR